MTVGTGIFLSSLLLAIVILYGLTKDRWAWRRIVKRTTLAVGGLLLLGIFAGAGIYGWQQIPREIPRQTKYASVGIGMSPDEVKYVKGYPAQVFGPAETEGDYKGSQPVIDRDKIEKGKSVDDFADWSYPENNHRIDVQFDAKKTAVIVVKCFSSDKLRRCPAIGGIADGDSEQEVIRNFGPPDSAKISGVTKSLYYSKIGVFFTLAQEQVYMFGINDTKYSKR